MTIETVILPIPGLSRSYVFYHTSDCHLAHALPQEGEAAAAKAKAQTDAWSYTGLLPADAMDEVLQLADREGVDGLFLCGDVADYLSEGTLQAIRERFEKTSTEIFYVCGNHERSGAETGGRAFYPAYQPWMQGSPDFWVRDLGEFVIVGMDNGDKQITQEQLEKLNHQFEAGKPILMLIHIPILTEAIMPDVRQKWGKDGPDYFLLGQKTDSEQARRFCEMLADHDAPVAAVFAGHIHLQHTGEIIPGRMQYVSGPAFEGRIRKYVITGE